MMIDLKADGRIKHALGEQMLLIESLRDQIEDLKAQLAECEKKLPDVANPTAE